MAGLGGATRLRCVTPVQTTAIHEEHAAEDATIIDARLGRALGKAGQRPPHLRLGQPEKVAHQSGLLAKPESRE